MRIENKPRHLIDLIRHHGLVEKAGERQIGEGHASRHALFAACRRKPGKRIPARSSEARARSVGKSSKT